MGEQWPLLNTRALALLSAVGGMAVAMRALRRRPFEIAPQLRLLLQGLVVALLFELVTVEITDIFDVLIIQQAGRLRDLENMQALALSGGWLLYAMALLLIGFAYRLVWLRLAAIGLFGISILKVFLSDLSFLQGPYRIVSFIALGLILLGVSYLYQRFKHLILNAEDEEGGPPLEPAPSA